MIKKSILITVIVTIIMIIIPSGFIVIEKHNDESIKVIHKYIEEAALKCYKEDVCKDSNVTLKTLYDLKYISKVADPITKKYYNENDYVIIDNLVANFIIKG